MRRATRLHRHSSCRCRRFGAQALHSLRLHLGPSRRGNLPPTYGLEFVLKCHAIDAEWFRIRAPSLVRVRANSSGSSFLFLIMVATNPLLGLSNHRHLCLTQRMSLCPLFTAKDIPRLHELAHLVDVCILLGLARFNVACETAPCHFSFCECFQFELVCSEFFSEQFLGWSALFVFEWWCLVPWGGNFIVVRRRRIVCTVRDPVKVCAHHSMRARLQVLMSYLVVAVVLRARRRAPPQAVTRDASPNLPYSSIPAPFGGSQSFWVCPVYSACTQQCTNVTFDGTSPMNGVVLS